MELDGANAVKDSYLRGIGLLNSANKGYYNFNGHGDVVGITDSFGLVMQEYDYDAFGVLKSDNAGDDNPFRYCGEYLDLESGTIYLRNRSYSPGVGRFLTEDPIGSGLNWYVYCGNNPVYYVDPLGEASAVLQNVANSNAGQKIVDIVAMALLAIGVTSNLSKTTNTQSSGSGVDYHNYMNYPNVLNPTMNNTIVGAAPYDLMKVVKSRDEKDAIKALGLSNFKREEFTLIYRSGSGNNTNLTPRYPEDWEGLSYFTYIPSGKDFTVTAVELVNATGYLTATPDKNNPKHYFVKPVPVSTLDDWMRSRDLLLHNGPGQPLIYTKVLQAISVKIKLK